MRERPREERARLLRQAAMSTLRLPGIDQEGVDNANRMLEMAGDLLTWRRHGWYPHKPGRKR